MSVGLPWCVLQRQLRDVREVRVDLLRAALQVDGIEPPMSIYVLLSQGLYTCNMHHMGEQRHRLQNALYFISYQNQRLSCTLDDVQAGSLCPRRPEELGNADAVAQHLDRLVLYDDLLREPI